MSNHYTHMIQKYADKDTSVLSRKDGGMVIGVRQGNIVGWGEDPRNQDQRVFTDTTYALSFLKRIADADVATLTTGKSQVATIEEVEGDSRILVPLAVQKTGRRI